eukprot:1312637-Alexandrium_andersonii.AAC.1
MPTPQSTPSVSNSPHGSLPQAVSVANNGFDDIMLYSLKVACPRPVSGQPLSVPILQAHILPGALNNSSVSCSPVPDIFIRAPSDGKN